MKRKIMLLIIVASSFMVNAYAQNKAIMIEAENAETIGSDFKKVTEGNVTYLTPSTDYANATNPGTADKVLTFKIKFDAPGTYDLYVKLRVGSGAYNDDSFYFGNGFGVKAVNVNSGWIRVNNIGNGSADPNAYVLTPDKNSAGNEIFKWINASKTGEGAAGGTLFVVKQDSLTQTFQFASRENGLDIDKIAFGNTSLFYTVSNLENGEAGVSQIPSTENLLSVDLSKVIRPVTHCANGSLYGITESLPSDINNFVAPLNPHVFVQPPRGGSGNQHPFGAAIPVSERLASTTGQVMIYLADLLPGWPYNWPGQTSWLSQVTSVINDKKASGRNNFYGYAIWNERHGTWLSSNGDFLTLCWKPTYDLIRSLDPNAKIIGPQDSYYTSARMTEFLTWCKNNNCLPDIIAWHELLGSANISNNIKSYRNVESSLGISALPIAISEYCHPTHENEGCPGTSAPFIAKFERNQVHSASISWWFTNLPGRLGSLLTNNNQKGGGWWFYKWYGDMTGNMVSVTPPNENSDGIDGFACLDLNKKYASICFGGNNTGTYYITVSEIPSSFKDSVYAKVEYISWSNKDTPVSGPTTVSNIIYKVSNGTITVPVEVTNPLYGYRVYITPAGMPDAVDAIQKTVPNNFALNQNYPNPFNPSTVINYQLPIPGNVSLKVFDILGREVATLVNEYKPAGNYNSKFSILNSNLSSGVYFYTLKAGNFIQTKKMILMK